MFKQISHPLAAPERGTPNRVQVRRLSHCLGRCEATFWRKTTRRDVKQILLAAKRFEVASRPAGSRHGPLGTTAIEILEYLANLVDFRTGRLDPSLDTIMKKIRRSRDAVVRGLKALRQHGFIDWLRRYVPIENDGSGPQLKQASNAYRLSLPDRARAYLDRYADPAPIPEDAEQRRQEHIDLIERHRASLDPGQRSIFDVGDNSVGRALAGLYERMKKRESAHPTVSLSTSISNRGG